MTEQKKISTTQLAKKRGIAQTQLFSDLSDTGLIKKENDKWILTEAGEQLGGVHLTGKYGQYVAWPEDIVFEKSAVKTVEQNGSIFFHCSVFFNTNGTKYLKS